ncbi:MAG: ABC transporter permease [Candidatus Peregrinibacteria bacterium]|nr:ABC transporter permease [Candidatus Peregrinibacteria bacterium]
MLRVVCAIGWADFVLKYRGSVLGYLWSFIAPLMKFLVILFVFQPLVGPAIPQYPLYLFLGLIVWEHFASTTYGCITMLIDKAPIIQKVVFPRVLLIFAVGWTNAIIFLTHVLIFLLFGFLLGVPPSSSLLYFLILLPQMTLLALGVGMALSAYFLKYQDIRHLWEIALQVLFWLTPVAYQYVVQGTVIHELANLFRESLSLSLWGFFQIFVRFQPLSILIHDARRTFLYAQTEGIPSPHHVLGTSAVCALIFLLGFLIFRKRSPYFVEEY